MASGEWVWKALPNKEKFPFTIVSWWPNQKDHGLQAMAVALERLVKYSWLAGGKWCGGLSHQLKICGIEGMST